MNSIIFALTLQNNGSGVHGAYMAPPSPSSISLLRYGFTVFYLKTFQCPVIPGLTIFFDEVNDICT